MVLADPPWSYYGQQDKWGAAAKFYPLMSDDEIRTFPMRSYLADNGILFCWTTSPRLDFAIECIKAWGLHYRGVAFVWVKTTKNGAPLKAQGVRPSIIKPLTEFVLCASPIERGRPLRLHDEAAIQTVFAPKQEHSTKPVAVHERLESMYPQASKIELFARARRAGWEAWGNQVA